MTVGANGDLVDCSKPGWGAKLESYLAALPNENKDDVTPEQAIKTAGVVGKVGDIRLCCFGLSVKPSAAENCAENGLGTARHQPVRVSVRALSSHGRAGLALCRRPKPECAKGLCDGLGA